MHLSLIISCFSGREYPVDQLMTNGFDLSIPKRRTTGDNRNFRNVIERRFRDLIPLQSDYTGLPANHPVVFDPIPIAE